MDFESRSPTTLDEVEAYSTSRPVSWEPPPSAQSRPSTDATAAFIELGGTTRGATDRFPQSILPAWDELLSAEVSVGLYHDLLRLALGGRVQLRSDSLKSFLRFWSLVRKDAVEPEVALAPDGTIHAEWYQSARKKLDIRFAVPKVFFGLFEGSNILEGVDQVERLAQILRDHPARPLGRSSR